VKRAAKVERKTTETNILVEMQLDGEGRADIDTTIPFLDHMLTLFAKHGLFDVTVRGQGDTHVDYHHLVEDLGICFGDVIKEALAGKEGIGRYGSAIVPMDESLCLVSLDLSGRPYLVFKADFDHRTVKDFDPIVCEEFFRALCDHAGITLHINVMYGRNPHHMIEAVFKAFARSLRKACAVDDRISGVMSTKGTL
jgi:imidazoleglycerol-phosphate dehydratase